MKFRCERDVLVDALGTAGRAATSRAALPVLSGLRLQLSGDQLRITGSDLDLTITRSLSVAGAEDGVAVLPAKLAVDIVRALEPGGVEVDTSGDRPSIRAGRSEFFLNAIPADEYPNPHEPEGESVTLQSGHLADGLRQVVGAASSDESRPILTGVLLAAEDGGLRLVSTDSYRLAYRDLPGTSLLEQGQQVLVPSRSLQELTRALGQDDDVTLVLSDQMVSFTVGDLQLSTRLIKGDFPDYRKLIPTDMPNALTVERQALADAIRRVRLMARENSPIRLSMGPDGLELRAITQDVGEAVEQLDAKYEGTELTVAFNPEYLMDGLEVTPGDEVVLQTRDAQRPAVLRTTDESDFLYLLMPVRVS
ncbi:MAG TPA: DNA polymerase III subunit beta [Microthrixaceae bacterium]|nr:DNA polymerase III subunit beta [Microthrixaceae bacterium]